MTEYRTMIIPFDFSDHSRAATLAAVDLGKQLKADLHLVHVLQAPSYAHGYGGSMADGALPIQIDMPAIRKSAENALAKVATGIGDYPGEIETHVVEGAAIAATLCETAERLHADLLVMGTHGRTGLAHAFLGSVAERTLRNAPCPVLTVRSLEEGSDEST